MRLGVNIDHVATLRQARRGKYPDPVTAAALAELGGADQITLHLREDRRHVNDRDLDMLRKTVNGTLNLEMATLQTMLELALNARPDTCTLVPERREELTTEGGLDVNTHRDEIKRVTRALRDASVEVSLFVDPDLEQIKACHRVDAQTVELHTGRYCEARGAHRHGKGGARHEGLDRMRLLTAAEQRELDRLAASEAALPTRVLMETAGAAVARAVLALAPRRVVVFCGPGNNGGDGYVAARLLSDSCDVYTWYTRPPEQLEGDAAAAYRAWRDAGGQDDDRVEDTGPGAVLVDAVFGSGLSRAPEGAEAAAIRAMNAGRERGAQIVAVDVPSGVESDTGAVYPVHLAGADVTVTFHAPKRGLYLHPGAGCAGRIQVADIGIPESLEHKLSGPACELIDEAWARAQLKPRPRNAHKNDFGHVLAVAGSPGKSGAAALVCEAALRAGAGLVTLAARAEVLPALNGLPEAMTV